MKKGLFITFEGGEGSGKSTLIEKVAKDLEGMDLSVVATRAPGGTDLGVSIRSLLLHTKTVHLSKRAELLLFLADRSQHVEEIIYKELEQGSVVLCDRFNDSTVAYQGAAREIIDEGLLENLLDFASYGLQPDLTLYLDVDTDIGLKRALQAREEKKKADFDRLENEEISFHKKVREGYIKLCQKHSERIVLIDANKSLEEVHSEVLKTIKSKISAHA